MERVFRGRKYLLQFGFGISLLLLVLLRKLRGGQSSIFGRDAFGNSERWEFLTYG